ncbi:MAG TPA: GNAT family N-acetyltransferase [Fimbriimonadaceae bacterium]|nr:GNAT family N-acetyltransferase [Fimbriimonadaceae bacterium]
MLRETERLRLRDWTIEDVHGAFRMYGDPEVTRYLGSGRTEPDLESQRHNLGAAIERMQARTDGLGWWAVEEKDTGEVAGAALLKPLPLSDLAEPIPGKEEIEIGWHLARDFWGRGYATEAASEIVRYAFHDLGLPEIIAVLYPENVPSARVAERLGMRYVGMTDRYYNVTVSKYVLDRVGGGAAPLS